MTSVKRTRILNTSRIMREIWINNGISRIDVARNLGFDKSTVTNIVSELLNVGVVNEISEGESTPQGGRKPINLEINKSFACIVGFEIQPDIYTAVAVNLNGDIIFSKSEKASIYASNLILTLFQLIESVKLELKKIGHPILGIGVGISGLVDPYEGVIKYSIPLKINKDLDFINEISELVETPVYIENDANCCSWGELVFHKEQRLKNFIFVLVEFRNADTVHCTYGGIAVGMGIVIDGHVYYGDNLAAGEFQSIFWASPNSGQFSLTDKEMLDVDKNKNLFTKFASELSKNLALIVNTYNIKYVFLGGDLEKNKTEIVEILSDEIQKNSRYPFKVDCSIKVSSFGRHSVAYGAAGMILNRLFADKEVSGTSIGVDLLSIK